MILISLLVHEKPEVLSDQIDNFRKFAPNSFIIIHPSRQFIQSNPKLIDQFKNRIGVVLNPKPLYTGNGMVLKCHVSNFIFAHSIRVDFSHVCLHSSNDLFVRHGVENYVKTNHFGFFRDDPLTGYNFSNWKYDFLKDVTYTRLMKSAGRQVTRYASQVEGTFYPRDEFSRFVEIFKEIAWNEIRYPITYSHGTYLKPVEIFNKLQRRPRARKLIGRYFYTKEEFYPPNFFSEDCEQPTSPYCYMNWDKELEITCEDIDLIRSGKVPDSKYQALFSVKRINRDINDKLRIKIRNLE